MQQNVSHVHLCPVCKGKGEIREKVNYTLHEITYKKCNGCEGKGLVVVWENYTITSSNNSINFIPPSDSKEEESK